MSIPECVSIIAGGSGSSKGLDSAEYSIIITFDGSLLASCCTDINRQVNVYQWLQQESVTTHGLSESLSRSGPSSSSDDAPLSCGGGGMPTSLSSSSDNTAARVPHNARSEVALNRELFLPCKFFIQKRLHHITVRELFYLVKS